MIQLWRATLFTLVAAGAAHASTITLCLARCLPLGLFTLMVPVGPTFFGVISTGDLIGRINIASLTTVPGELIDNLAFGGAAPEPTSLLLLGTGGLGLLVTRRRRKSKTRRAKHEALRPQWPTDRVG